MAAPAIKTTDPWCVIADLPARATDNDYNLDLTPSGEVFDWIQVASDILFEFTRRRWPGVTTRTIRPVIDDISTRLVDVHVVYGGAFVGSLVQGYARTDIGTHTVDGVSEILLPNPPAVSIGEVLIDGVAVASARYRIDDFRRLVYLPTAGETRSAWPAWQDLDKAATEDGTWEVTYNHGTPPPEGGVRACAHLATEMAIAASPTTAGQSRLPSRITNLSRQGISATILDPLDLFDDAKTGLPIVDIWVASVNLGAKRRTGRVYRLGQRRHRRAT